jgi:hypothetical protein
MLYYWWLLSLAIPVVMFDLFLRGPYLIHPGVAWPLGLEYLAQEGS